MKNIGIISIDLINLPFAIFTSGCLMGILNSMQLKKIFVILISSKLSHII